MSASISSEDIAGTARVWRPGTRSPMRVLSSAGVSNKINLNYVEIVTFQLVNISGEVFGKSGFSLVFSWGQGVEVQKQN